MNENQYCGKWVGEYTYGEEYDDPVKGKRVAFELDIQIVNGLLKGECTDAETTAHFQQPATIEGSVLGNTISFVKRYPYYWQNEKDGQRYLPKLPSQEILYSGQFVNDRFEGEWEIIIKLADAQGDFISFRGFGHWYMKKEV